MNRKAGAPTPSPRDAGVRPGTADASGEPGSIDKIRDILFGQQVRDYDRRFGQLEERVRKEMADLRSESMHRLDALEGYVKRELATLLERLKGEKDERSEALKDASRELQAAAKGLEKRLHELDDRLAKKERSLREEMLEQSKTLQDQIRAQGQEGAAALGRAVAELRHLKTDRSALSAILAELAVRIGDDTEAGA